MRATVRRWSSVVLAVLLLVLPTLRAEPLPASPGHADGALVAAAVAPSAAWLPPTDHPAAGRACRKAPPLPDLDAGVTVLPAPAPRTTAAAAAAQAPARPATAASLVSLHCLLTV